ncbi:transketolase family protein [Pectinatus frisingensis]|jgi:transketolase|uniref:transketolase family protein n=1 Tax=Pectinatus frisingensis TaxID=865 RepID=UPI0015F36484|nr:transketolase family protein [Pectinatus frisingensis]
MGIAMRETFGRTLQLMKDDPRLVVLDADLGSATKSLMFKSVCPQRYIDVGIAEQDMVGTAAGLSVCGMIPIVSTFSVFLVGRALDQIRNTIAYPNLNVKLAGTHAGVSVGYDGASHEAVADLAIMRALPNMTVLCSSDAPETAAMLKTAYNYQGPVYMRISRIGVNDYHDENYKFKIGQGEIICSGTDCSVIATGIMVPEAITAAKLLKKSNISLCVINMPSIKPIDRNLIIRAAKVTGAIVTAEEHNIIGGLGSAVSEVLSTTVPVPMQFVGIKDCYGTSGDSNVLLQAYHLKATDIAAAVKKAITMKNNM